MGFARIAKNKKFYIVTDIIKMKNEIRGGKR